MTEGCCQEKYKSTNCFFNRFKESKFCSFIKNNLVLSCIFSFIYSILLLVLKIILFPIRLIIAFIILAVILKFFLSDRFYKVDKFISKNYDACTISMSEDDLNIIGNCKDLDVERLIKEYKHKDDKNILVEEKLEVKNEHTIKKQGKKKHKNK